MTTVNEFHQEAMDLAEEAFRLLRSGEDDESQRLFRDALSSETQAASLLPRSQESEPSRSILYRSAASLAFNAGDYENAERLVAEGLSGFPPLEIREELNNLQKDINRKRHLQTQGVVETYTRGEISYRQQRNYNSQAQEAYAPVPYSQDAINSGQQRINYALCQADMKIIEALTSIINTLKTVAALPHLQNVDLSMMETAIEEASEAINKIAEIRPPGCEPPDPR